MEGRRCRVRNTHFVNVALRLQGTQGKCWAERGGMEAGGYRVRSGRSRAMELLQGTRVVLGLYYSAWKPVLQWCDLCATWGRGLYISGSEPEEQLQGTRFRVRSGRLTRSQLQGTRCRVRSDSAAADCTLRRSGYRVRKGVTACITEGRCL